MRFIISAAALALVISSSYAGIAPPPRDLDVLHYDVAIEIPAQGENVAIETTVTLKALVELRTVELELSGMTLSSVTERGASTTFTRTGQRVSVTLSSPLAPYEVTSLTFHYKGRPDDGLVIGRNKHGDRTVFADNWPDRAHHWIVSRDHPADKASIDFTVTAPPGDDVLANGELQSVKRLSPTERQWHWSEPTPIPVYSMVIGVARFTIVNPEPGTDTDVSYYLYPEDAAAGGKQFGSTAAMMRFFTSRVGPYPYGKLAIAQSTTRFSGMENSGAIFLAEKSIGGDAWLEGLVAHEMAHQWFGDSVTPERWQDLWLSEGFATYFGALFLEHAYGREMFVQRVTRARKEYFDTFRERPTPIFDPSISDPAKLLGPNVYLKGAWTLHMLRRLIGDEAFFAGIADYYAAYRDRNASTGDFEAVMSRHAGQPLDWFFKQWIYGRSYPILSARWSWSADDRKLRIRVSQNQQWEALRFPLDLEIRTAAGGRRESIDVAERVVEVTLSADEKPLSVTLDPDQWLLTEVEAVREERIED